MNGMNRWNFIPNLSKTQYDLYKYKIGDSISYGKRKVYRYPVHGMVYDLKTELHFKYLYKLNIHKDSWDKFRTETWEHLLHELNIYEDVIDHVRSLASFNGFNSITFPDGNHLIDDLVDTKSDLELKVDWFRDEKFRPHDKQLYLVIFHY
jgi:hypothetical protein